MASLAIITNEIRIILKFLGISAFTLVILYVFFVSGSFLKDTFFPTPTPPPEQGFGELPEVVFPSQTPADYDFIVNTTSGNLPDHFPDRMTVYKTIVDEPNLVALQNARKSVGNSGFTQAETKVNDELYQWTNRQGDRIEINILTRDFKILSNYTNSAPPPIITGSIEDKEGAYGVVMGFLQTLGITTSDLSLEKSELRFMRLNEGALIEAENKNNAQFVRLDIHQAPIEDYEIYYPAFTESTMHFVLRNDSGTIRIVDANFIHSVPDLENGSTYPILTVEEAFIELQNGNAIFTSSEPSGSSIDITDVTLGYYLGEVKQQYLLPIVVFNGVNFTGYIKAVRDYSPPVTTQ